MIRFILVFFAIFVMPGCSIFEEKPKDELVTVINKEIKTKPAASGTSKLLSFANVKRLGAFRIPNVAEAYHARGAIEVNPSKNSFYMGGHERRNYIAEFGIPSVISNSTNINDLPTATLLQNFQSIMKKVSGGNSEQVDRLGGLKLITDSNGRTKLIGSSYEFYDTSGQTYTHFVVNDPNNLASTSVDGYYSIAGPARKQYGYMVQLPQKWQQIFGKTHIVGQSSGPAIINGMSVGPAAYAVNLGEIGNKSNPDTVTLLEYDFKAGRTLNPLGPDDKDNDSRTNDIWTRLSWATGVFISGDTIGFLGHSGGHKDGVAYKKSVQNPCIQTGGYGAHNCDFDYHYWFYDLNDLKKVMDGDLMPYLIQPYEQGPFELPWENGRYRSGGVATDTRTGHVYFTQLQADKNGDFSSLPVVHVFDVDATTETVIVNRAVVLPNKAPVLTSIGNREVVQNELLQLTINASDPDNNALTISAQGLPQGASFNGNVFNWTPGSNQSGSYNVTFKVTDNQLSDSETISITVKAPVVTTTTTTPTVTSTSTFEPVFLNERIISSVSELQSAVKNLKSGDALTLQPGVYNLSGTLYLPNRLSNVTIRGATDKHNDVIIVGKGMTDNSGATPFGIWSNDTQGIKIANLTLKNFLEHAIMLNADVNSPHVYNVRMTDIGDQFIKGASGGRYGDGVDNGIVESSIMEYTRTAPDDYTNAIDVHGGDGWIIRNNVFRNIRAPAGQLAGPAILMWNGSKNTVTESNLFLNNQRGISYGLIDRSSYDHEGGIIRNNIFYRSSSQSGDVGISIYDSPNTKVLNNTLIMSGTYNSAIEYRFSGSHNVEIVNNLTDAGIRSRSNGSASVKNNITTAESSWFVNVAANDLHIKSTTSLVIDKAIVHSAISSDFDGDSREAGNPPDIGADEYSENKVVGSSNSNMIPVFISIFDLLL